MRLSTSCGTNLKGPVLTYEREVVGEFAGDIANDWANVLIISRTRMKITIISRMVEDHGRNDERGKGVLKYQNF